MCQDPRLLHACCLRAVSRSIKENSPVGPKVHDNWRITGIDLSENDPRRAEIIGYINEGLLPTPYDKSYNLADYDELVAQANANREAGLSVWGHEGK